YRANAPRWHAFRDALRHPTVQPLEFPEWTRSVQNCIPTRSVRNDGCLAAILRLKQHPRIFNRKNPNLSEYFFALAARIRVNIKKFSPADQ
ncbi:hypothetical protein, partial [Pseudomonas syringae]|uniref:hypothetical protein n=1 Tax=Pseudomonas syringae TaxID=317 RepID=UPI001C1F6ABD